MFFFLHSSLLYFSYSLYFFFLPSFYTILVDSLRSNRLTWAVWTLDWGSKEPARAVDGHGSLPIKELKGGKLRTKRERHCATETKWTKTRSSTKILIVHVLTGDYKTGVANRVFKTEQVFLHIVLCLVYWTNWQRAKWESVKIIKNTTIEKKNLSTGYLKRNAHSRRQQSSQSFSTWPKC